MDSSSQLGSPRPRRASHSQSNSPTQRKRRPSGIEMDSSPPASAPRPLPRLGPYFASDNDPVTTTPGGTTTMDDAGVGQASKVEEEIDELLSDTEEGPAPGAGASEVKYGAVCKWEGCDERFDELAGLVEHVNTGHIPFGKSMYSCDWRGCPRFGQKQASRHSLSTHVRAHTGERPYICPQPGCGRTFTRSDALSKHQRGLHNVQSKKAKSTPTTSSTAKKAAQLSSPALSSRLALNDDMSAGADSPDPMLLGDSQSQLDSEQAGAPKKISKKRKTVAEKRQEAESLQVATPGMDGGAGASGSAASKITTTKAKSRKSLAGSAPLTPQQIWPPPPPPPQYPRPIVDYTPPYPESIVHLAEFDELLDDLDLGAAIPRLRKSRGLPVARELEDDMAWDLIKQIRANPTEVDPIEDFPPQGEPQVIGKTFDHSNPNNPAMLEFPVMSRSDWQVQYMLIKAKIMLLEEENQMRRNMLIDAAQDEEALDQAAAEMMR